MVDKVKENRVRRAVARRGYQLQKARRRDPKGFDYGTFQIIDPWTNEFIHGDITRGYGLSLDDVETWLKETP
jgi:hypothetical protein